MFANIVDPKLVPPPQKNQQNQQCPQALHRASLSRDVHDVSRLKPLYVRPKPHHVRRVAHPSPQTASALLLTTSLSTHMVIFFVNCGYDARVGETYRVTYPII